MQLPWYRKLVNTLAVIVAALLVFFAIFDGPVVPLLTAVVGIGFAAYFRYKKMKGSDPVTTVEAASQPNKVDGIHRIHDEWNAVRDACVRKLRLRTTRLAMVCVLLIALASVLLTTYGSAFGHPKSHAFDSDTNSLREAARAVVEASSFKLSVAPLSPGGSSAETIYNSPDRFDLRTYNAGKLSTETIAIGDQAWGYPFGFEVLIPLSDGPRKILAKALRVPKGLESAEVTSVSGSTFNFKVPRGSIVSYSQTGRATLVNGQLSKVFIDHPGKVNRDVECDFSAIGTAAKVNYPVQFPKS